MQASLSVITEPLSCSVAAMDTIGKRIKRLRSAARLTQQELADELSRETRTKVTRGAVGNWELDGGISVENLTALARVLNSTVEYIHDGVGQEPATPPLPAPKRPGKPAPNVSPAPPLGRPTRTLLPIFGRAVMGESGSGKMIFGENQRVGEIYAPPSLEAVEGAYAVYAHGDSMLDRFRHGEVLHVHPHRPVAAGDDVVIQVREDDGELSGYVKRFKRWTADLLIVEQLNPPPGEEREMTFQRRSVVHVHKIVGTGE